MRDPLLWWPGKYADCKRIAQLVAEFLPAGEVLEFGSLGLFAELLPRHEVTTAGVAVGPRACLLPYDNDRFDVGVSARVVELLPPALRPTYLRELLRVCRYRVFLALPLQPELEAIDKIKNTYVWDTTRVWQHPGLRPQDLERLLDGQEASLTFHVEAPPGVDAAADAPRERLFELLAAPPSGPLDAATSVTTPNFVVAEISKADVMPGALAGLGTAAH